MSMSITDPDTIAMLEWINRYSLPGESSRYSEIPVSYLHLRNFELIKAEEVLQKLTKLKLVDKYHVNITTEIIKIVKAQGYLDRVTPIILGYYQNKLSSNQYAQPSEYAKFIQNLQQTSPIKIPTNDDFRVKKVRRVSDYDAYDFDRRVLMIIGDQIAPAGPNTIFINKRKLINGKSPIHLERLLNAFARNGYIGNWSKNGLEYIFYVGPANKQLLADELKKIPTVDNLGVKKDIIIDPQETTYSTPLTTLEKGKWGYFKFSDKEKDILIAKISTRPFRLLRALANPFGTPKSIEAVFESIKKPQDLNSTELAPYSPAGVRKETILKKIEWAKKELQKNPHLKGRLRFCYDEGKKAVWLELSE